jgi:hypothetical protein
MDYDDSLSQRQQQQQALQLSHGIYAAIRVGTRCRVVHFLHFVY